MSRQGYTVPRAEGRDCARGVETTPQGWIDRGRADYPGAARRKREADRQLLPCMKTSRTRGRAEKAQAAGRRQIPSDFRERRRGNFSDHSGRHVSQCESCTRANVRVCLTRGNDGHDPRYRDGSLRRSAAPRGIQTIDRGAWRRRAIRIPGAQAGRQPHLDFGKCAGCEGQAAARLSATKAAWKTLPDRKRAELEQQVTTKIIHSMSATHNLDDLLHSIHAALKEVLYAENCFVALYEQSTGMFHFPFCVDQYDPPSPPQRIERSCTDYVFRTGQPMIITQAVFDELVARGEVKLVGTPSATWIGVPLRTPDATIGVLVLQHYEDTNAYTKRDLDFLILYRRADRVCHRAKTLGGARARKRSPASRADRAASRGAVDGGPGSPVHFGFGSWSRAAGA